MRKGRKGIREIEWGQCAGEGGSCIYDNGHIDKTDFLKMLRESCHLDTPADVLCDLDESRVVHTRFRPMSPSEAKNWGGDYGVMQADGQRGYPVTAIFFK